jgi:hypothetical protein
MSTRSMNSFDHIISRSVSNFDQTEYPVPARSDNGSRLKLRGQTVCGVEKGCWYEG